MADNLFRKEQVFETKAKKAEEPYTTIDKLRDDYRTVFSSPAGKRVFMDLLKQCYVFTPFEQQNAGAYLKEGKREIGLYILGCVGFSENPNQLRKLIEMLQGGISDGRGRNQQPG